MGASENKPWADIPESMAEELGAWNNGEGISLDGWINFEGSFRLAVGYTTLFWPQFVAFEDYIFRKGFSEEQVRGLESQEGSTAQSVEWVVNHLHLSDIHYHDRNDISSDKLVILGNALREIYQAKLHWQFPEKPCVVDFNQPNDPGNYVEYQLSFWQAKHDQQI